MSSPKSLNNTLDALLRLTEPGQAIRIGWSDDFCKQVKKDIAVIRSTMKEVNYYGGINSLLDLAKIGAQTLPLFDLEEDVKP